MMMKLNPYLFFNGNAEEAFRYYHAFFGGDLFIQRMSETPDADQLSPEEQQLVMHIAIPIGDGQFLMASDTIPSMGQTYQPGNQNYISVICDSREEADRLFLHLSQGGTIENPMEEMFFGDYFGSVIDRFQVGWMIHFPLGH
jgi:PhnB protein